MRYIDHLKARYQRRPTGKTVQDMRVQRPNQICAMNSFPLPLAVFWQLLRHKLETSIWIPTPWYPSRCPGKFC